jgi:hypothetical protein
MTAAPTPECSIQWTSLARQIWVDGCADVDFQRAWFALKTGDFRTLAKTIGVPT